MGHRLTKNLVWLAQTLVAVIIIESCKHSDLLNSTVAKAAPAGGALTEVKVLTLGMMDPEVKLWIERKSMTHSIDVPGAMSPLHCNDQGHCAMALGMGTANVSASMMALGLNQNIDLSHAYILIQGIAGGTPELLTLGAAAWSSWAVDADTHHHIDEREMPQGWKFADFHLGCGEPWCPGWKTGTEVFHVNETLTEQAFQWSKDIALADVDAAKTYRQKYNENLPAAHRPPFVTKCDVISGGYYFHGKIMSQWASWWVKQWTEGKGVYCTSAMEETGILTSLTRLSTSRRIDFERVMIMRAVANFEQPYDGLSAVESLRANKGAFGISLENSYRVGSVVTDHLLADWHTWQNGVIK